MTGLIIYLLWIILCVCLSYLAQKKYGTYNTEIPYDPNQLEVVSRNLQYILWVFLAAIWGGLAVFIILSN